MVQYIKQVFKTLVLEQCSKYVPVFKTANYKIPWHSKELKDQKNLRNKFDNKFKSTKEDRFYVL